MLNVRFLLWLSTGLFTCSSSSVIKYDCEHRSYIRGWNLTTKHCWLVYSVRLGLVYLHHLNVEQISIITQIQWQNTCCNFSHLQCNDALLLCRLSNLHRVAPPGTMCLLRVWAKQSSTTLTIDSSLFTAPFTLTIRIYGISFPLQDLSLELCGELGSAVVVLSRTDFISYDYLQSISLRYWVKMGERSCPLWLFLSFWTPC